MRIFLMYTFILMAAFAYIFFFTQALPPFWEAYQFHEGFARQSAFSLLWQTISFSGNVLEKAEPAYGLYFKLLFAVFGYDFSGGFRIVKAFVFASVVVALFCICRYLFTDWRIAVFPPILVMTAYPVYIHTMVFDEAFILAEFLKLTAIAIFLSDLTSEKSSLGKQVLIFLLSVLAFKSYPPAASIFPLFVLTVLFFHRNKVKHYGVLLCLLFIMIFPFSSFTTGKTSGPFGFHLENIPQLFTNDLGKNSMSPLNAFDLSDYTFRGLYWKSFPNLITFFGIWLIIISLSVFIVTGCRYVQREEKEKRKWSASSIFVFGVIWMFVEIPIFISVPEPATRYLSAFIVPFIISSCALVSYMLKNIPLRFVTSAKCGIVIVVGLIVVANILNTTFFRIRLGSDIIAMGKVSMILEETTNSCIVYAPIYVADQYLLLNKTNKRHEIRNDLIRIQAKGKEDFTIEKLRHYKEKCVRLFVVQQKSIMRQTLFPSFDYRKEKEMHLVQHIQGINKSLFDRFLLFIRDVFHTRNWFNEYLLWEYI